MVYSCEARSFCLANARLFSMRTHLVISMNFNALSICAFGLVTGTVLAANVGFGKSELAGSPESEVPRRAPRAVILGDYNADGLSEIFAVNPYGDDRLYRNEGDGSFVDVTIEAGLAGLNGTRAVLFDDYDGDGLSDLLILGAHTTRLFRNIGGLFVDETVRAGLAEVGVAVDAEWVDFEGDGVFDLMLHNSEGVQLYGGLGDATFNHLKVTVPGVGPLAPGALSGGPGQRSGVNSGSTGGGSSAASAGITWSGTGAGPNMAAGSVLACAGSIEDQANPGTGSCLPASSVPALGHLYPLGAEFSIDGSGRILVGGHAVIDSNGEWIGASTGLVGPPGEEGDQGPAGPQGDQGPTGATGPAGPAGSEGAEGPAGPQGDLGPTGPTGPAGPAGSEGAEGPAGPQGDQGPTGPTGPAGPAGSEGQQGDQGPTGPTGPAGPQGDSGTSSWNDSPGVVQTNEWVLVNNALSALVVDADALYADIATVHGDATVYGDGIFHGDLEAVWFYADDVNAQRLNGSVSVSSDGGYYASGSQVINSTGEWVGSSSGLLGPEGPTGPEGPAGQEGPEGPEGPAGAEGPAGSEGPQGDAGPPGPEGDQGPQGPQGQTGSQGPPGPEGPSGTSSWTDGAGFVSTTFEVNVGGSGAPEGEFGVTPNLQIVDDDNVASVVIANSGSNKDAELWLGEGASGLGLFRMGWRYDGDDNSLNTMSHVHDPDIEEGVDRGPWMTIMRDTGFVGMNEGSPRNTVSIGPYLDIYTGGVQAVTQNSIRASENNLILNAKEDNGDLYLNYDTGDDVYVGVNGATESTTLLDVNGRINAANSNPGVSGATITAENLNGSGIAIFGKVDGSDATAVFGQDGSGDIIKGFNGGASAVFRVTNSGRTVTTALQITGGGDLVEGFMSPEGALDPGTVVIIDSENPGQLKTSSVAYDRKVAGVVSGAGGINHGIRMGQDDVLDGENLVALTGRVYVKCTDENGAIEAGDLLTTAGTAGHAMRADDPDRSFGSVIGKAMTSLDAETGLVLVLVNLQ